MSSSKRFDFLKTQFPKIDDDTFEKIVACDPTPEGKYCSWLLRMYSKSKLDLKEIEPITKMLAVHLSMKNELPAEFRDINKFDSVLSFLSSINIWFTSRFLENEKNIKYLKSGGNLIFENDSLTVIEILSHEGSVAYGSGTSWCTLQADTYASYSKNGHLYIVTPKNAKYKALFNKKTQLYFTKSEFRNDTNQEIDLIGNVLKLPELYDIFRSIDEVKKSSKVKAFFFIEESTTEERKAVIKQYGLGVLSVIKAGNFTLDFTNLLFLEYQEQVYDYIPDSKNKTISFVTHVREGLKKIIIKAEIEITKDIFTDAVLAFPENILLMDCKDEALWETCIADEPWLINRSPFIQDAKKLFELSLINSLVLKYLSSSLPEQPKTLEKLFNAAQIKELAKNLVTTNCININLLNLLGELDEKFQIELVELNVQSVNYFLNPAEKAKKKTESILKKREEDKKKLEEEKRKARELREKEKEEEERKRMIEIEDFDGVKRAFFKKYDNGGYDDYNDYQRREKYEYYTDPWSGKMKQKSHNNGEIRMTRSSDGIDYYQAAGKIFASLEEARRYIDLDNLPF